MIGIKENDGIVRQPVLLQFTQETPRIPVHHGHAIIHARPLLPDHGRIRIVGGQRNGCRIVDLLPGELGLHFTHEHLVRPHRGAGLMGAHVVEHRKERLAFPALVAAPMRLATRLVPRFRNQALRRPIVIVGLDVVGGEVTGLPQIAGKGLHPVRNREGRPHLVRPQADRGHARDEAGP